MHTIEHRMRLVALCVAVVLGGASACGTSHGGVDDAGAGIDAARVDSGARPDTGVVVIDAGAVDAGNPGLFSCTWPTDCIVRSRSCCGSCGQATPDDMIGVSAARAGEYGASVCAGVPCPGCLGQPDPWLLSACDGPAPSARQCRAFDLRTDPITECTTSDDCILAVPRCCACGTDSQFEVIAINRLQSSALANLICSPAADCAPCAGPPHWPLGAIADCAGGRCIVNLPGG